MARTVQQIQEELDKVTAQNKANFDALNAQPESSGRTFNPGGLQIQYDAAVNSGDTATVNKLKPKLEAAQKAYKQSQEKKNALTKELADAQKSEAKSKENVSKIKSAQTAYDTALANLEKATQAKDQYKGTENYAAAYQAAQKAYDAVVASGVPNPKQLPDKILPVPDYKTLQNNQQNQNQNQPQQESLDLGKFHDTLADPKNKEILKNVQQSLAKNWGYKGKTDGVYSLQFQAALDDVANKRSQLPLSLQGINFQTFLSTQNKSVFSGSGTGTGTPTGFATIYSDNQAANIIQNTFSSMLGRDATEAEIKKYSKQLIAAQSDPKNAAKQVIKNGIQQTIGGFNPTQFIEDIIRGSEEYKNKKASGYDSAKQQLSKIAMANGLDLEKNFASTYDNWAKRIAAGEDSSSFFKLIRDTAKTGMPQDVQKLLDQGVDLETIYAPYKSTMQSVLEIPAGTISISDPTLRTAFGGEKPMTFYDFQSSLRKDPRWQYTANAHSTVDNAVQQILKDFGFMR